MNDLLVAAVFFVGTHIGIAGTQIRGQLIERVGGGIYRLLYSLISIVALFWMIGAYGDAPYFPLLYEGSGLRHLTLIVMPVSLLLLIGGVTTPNPTSVGQEPDPDSAEPAGGMLRITRHPVMWAIGLWALAHMLANPDLASLIFFGSFAILAFVGCHSLDTRRDRKPPPGWGVFVQRTSFLPFAAIAEGRQKFVWSEIGWWRLLLALLIFVLLLLAHPYLFGVSVFAGDIMSVQDSMEAIIEAAGLEKTFGDVEAVKGIDLSIPNGRCIGLLGPNGAGKTTTMRMIMGLVTPTAGKIRLMGFEPSNLPRDVRARVGLVPQENNLDPDLTVRQNLEIYGRYYGLALADIAERVPQLLEFMQLANRADAQVMHLSGGMKRRLIIARAVIGNPDLIILDEPTTGLDPQARVMIWRQLSALKKQGKTLLLTTHYMDEAERLCDSITMIDHGKILDEGTPKELIARHVKGHVLEIEKPLPRDLPLSQTEDLGDSVLLFVDEVQPIIQKLPAETAFTHRPANLEDVFLRLTGRQLREG